MAERNSEAVVSAGKLADAAGDQRVLTGVALAFVLNYAGFFPEEISTAMFVGAFAVVFALSSLSR